MKNNLKKKGFSQFYELLLEKNDALDEHQLKIQIYQQLTVAG